MCIQSLRHRSKPLENITGIVLQIDFGKFSEYLNSTVFISHLFTIKFDCSEDLTYRKSTMWVKVISPPKKHFFGFFYVNLIIKNLVCNSLSDSGPGGQFSLFSFLAPGRCETNVWSSNLYLYLYLYTNTNTNPGGHFLLFSFPTPGRRETNVWSSNGLRQVLIKAARQRAS